MASQLALAARKASGIERLTAAQNELSKLTGVEPVLVPGKRHDAEFMRMQETEANATFLENLIEYLAPKLTEDKPGGAAKNKVKPKPDET